MEHQIYGRTNIFASSSCLMLLQPPSFHCCCYFQYVRNHFFKVKMVSKPLRFLVRNKSPRFSGTSLKIRLSQIFFNVLTEILIRTAVFIQSVLKWIPELKLRTTTNITLASYQQNRVEHILIQYP